MSLQPNLSGLLRLGYIVAGVGLMAGGFFGVEAGWARYGLPIAGAVVLIEGLIAF
jgi:hypothetical protein